MDINLFNYADVKQSLTSGSTDILLTKFVTNEKIPVNNLTQPVEIFQNLQFKYFTDSITFVEPKLQERSVMNYHKVSYTKFTINTVNEQLITSLIISTVPLLIDIIKFSYKLILHKQ